MTDITRDELGAPKIIDRSTFQASWTHCGFERRLTQEKGMPLRPPADGSPWLRWMAPHRSVANVAR
jgi:hypothetical protein